ncbi:MAG: uracil phosphoribosyltransferase [Bacteroidota bacterium]
MITVLEHPLVRRDITILRNVETDPATFRAAAARVGIHLAIAATQTLELENFTITTPLEETQGFKTANPLILMPILRAGVAMLAPFSEVIPQAAIGYLGLRRNEETLQPEEYMFSFPPTEKPATVFLLDPMLATGGSMCASIRRVRREGVKNIIIACMIAAPEGIERVRSEFPDIPIITAALDRELNEIGFILPGLGDAGDRFHG